VLTTLKTVILFLMLLFAPKVGMLAQSPQAPKLFVVNHTPGSDRLKIVINGSQPNLDKFYLMNLIGKTLIVKPYLLNENEIEITELNSYTSGLYVILARDKTGKLLSSVKIYL
jgi:hypothetical protein